MAEAIHNKMARANFRRVMGDYHDNREADAYEQRLFRDDRLA